MENSFSSDRLERSVSTPRPLKRRKMLCDECIERVRDFLFDKLEATKKPDDIIPISTIMLEVDYSDEALLRKQLAQLVGRKRLNGSFLVGFKRKKSLVRRVFDFVLRK